LRGGYPKNTVIIDMTVMQGVRVTVAAVGRGYPKTAVTTVTAVTPKDGHPPKERRNPPMPYAILRFQKRKAGGVAACERHNERKKEAYKSNPDIDMERSKNNYHLIAPPKYTYKKEDGDGYEVIAGQRRVRASELAGINTVPAFVLPLDRDRAIITLVFW
jgi:hypothetical protein